MHAVRPWKLGETPTSAKPPAWLRSAAQAVVPAFSAGAEVGEDGGWSSKTPDLDDPMAELQAELTALREAAEAEGLAAGEARAAAEAEESTRRLATLLQDLEQARELALYGAEEQLCELAVAIARALIGDDIAADLLRALVREAIDVIGEAEEIVLSVNERDLGVVRAEAEQLASTLSRQCRLRVRADASIEQGCRVDTPLAQVDATVEGRLTRVREALLGRGAEA